MSELPEGWAETSLTSIFVSSLGGDWGKDCADGLNGYEKVRVVRGTDFKDWKTHRAARAAERCIKQSSLVSRRLAEGDIVVEVSGGGPTQPVGRTILIDKVTLDNSPLPLVCSNFFRQVRLHELIDSAYVNHFLSHAYFKGEFDEFQTQTTNLRNLNFTKFLEGIRINLPPLDEQRRIVAKLEKLLSRVSAAQARLAALPRILKRFRQSVLAAACSGRLTADWREESPKVEPASQLIERINQRRKLKTLVDILEAHECPEEELPSSWVWIRFGSVIGELRNGISIRPNIKPPGLPILRISAARPGKIDLDETRYLPNGKDFIPLYKLQERDLLFTRYNGSLELLGVCGMVRGLNKSVLLYPDKLMRVRFDHEFLMPEYVEVFFQVPAVHERVIAKSKSSAGQNGVSGSDIKAQAVALPPLAEQQEIVRRVEALFKTADALEARYRTAKAHVDKLTQSILARAFRGELVTTEAELARQEGRDYEPASALLERIRQERAQQSTSAKPKPKQRRAASKAASSTKLFT